VTPTAQKLGAGLSWLLSVGLWVEDVQKHVALVAGCMTILLTVLLILNAVLDNFKKRREEREAHRKELHEIEEETCTRRQQTLKCPRIDWTKP